MNVIQHLLVNSLMSTSREIGIFLDDEELTISCCQLWSQRAFGNSQWQCGDPAPLEQRLNQPFAPCASNLSWIGRNKFPLVTLEGVD